MVRTLNLHSFQVTESRLAFHTYHLVPQAVRPSIIAVDTSKVVVIAINNEHIRSWVVQEFIEGIGVIASPECCEPRTRTQRIGQQYVRDLGVGIFRNSNGKQRSDEGSM